MKSIKYNLLEIIGVVLMAIGGIIWLSKKLDNFDLFDSINGWADVILPLGLLFWAIGYMRKESIQKSTKE